MAVDSVAKRQREPDPEPEVPYYPEAGPAPKKGRVEDPDAPPVEKRQAIFKKKCPKAIEERFERVMSQRFTCIERQRTGETTEEFKVLGSTGNVYDVKVGCIPRCSCPDGAKNNHCKHIVFCMVKILRIPHTSNLWYQKALLKTELESIFANAPRDRTSVAEQKLRDAYAVTMGKKAAPLPGEESGTEKRLPAKDDSCPVCYEDFEEGQTKDLVFCLSLNGCGNGLHSECHAQWAAKTKPVTCVFCRAPWTGPIAALPAAGPSYSAEGYLNMAAQAGTSTIRDTSSYYHGPQKGKKWDGGWGRYGRY